MPHTPAAAKSLRQNVRRRERNLHVLKSVRKSLHDSRRAIRLKNIEEAKKLVLATIKALDRAVAKGIVKKNTAARKKSRLVRAMNKGQ